MSKSKDDFIQKTMQEVNEMKPVIRACGFKLSGVELEVSIPPAVVVEMEKIGNVDRDKLAVLANQEDLSTTKKAIISALVKAADYDEKLQAKKFKVKSVSCKISVPPSISIRVEPFGDDDEDDGKSNK